VSFEPKPENAEPAHSLLAPPAGATDGVRAIFWNERELRAGWRLALFSALFAGFFRAGNRAVELFQLPHGASGNVTAVGVLILESVMLAASLGAAAIMARLEGRPFGTFGLPGTGAFRARFWNGFAWGLAMVTATILLIRLLNGFSFGELALHGAARAGYGALWLVAFVAVGLAEEFLFRGYPQFTLARGIGFWPAASVISALFAAGHLGNTGEDKAGAAGVFVFAMFLCLTLRRTGNLWFAVGLHAAFDWGETFLFSVPDSGLVAPGHLLNSSFHGPVWLTGGTVGPEGSVMVFVVLALAAAIFSRVFPARESILHDRPDT
jgi:membrane protease YdiL (CAAX protease family)